MSAKCLKQRGDSMALVLHYHQEHHLNVSNDINELETYRDVRAEHVCFPAKGRA